MVIEGVAYALFPSGMKRAMAAVADMPPAILRRLGLLGAITGLVAIWMVRSAMFAP